MRHDDRLRMIRSRRTRGGALAVYVAACVAGLAGCQPSGSREFTLWNPFGFRNPFQPDQPPLRIGMVADTQGVFDPRTWVETFKTPPWEDLSKHLSSELKRPVQVEPLTADQIAFHLQSGRIQFALVSGADVERIRDKTPEFLEIARAEAATRKGVIVADADSGIRSISELRGKRFAFGPSGDPILDTAAKEALQKAGVAIDDLKREILPIPGTLQYHLSSFEVAKEIVYGGTPAGVIDHDEFESLPARGGKFTWKGFYVQPRSVHGAGNHRRGSAGHDRGRAVPRVEEGGYGAGRTLTARAAGDGPAAARGVPVAGVPALYAAERERAFGSVRVVFGFRLNPVPPARC